tara:strand:+ start:1049 stop:1378 length:330 start_codon:yes stop_codon:yes gene_type:complete
MTQKNKHPLWNKELAEAKDFFSGCYFDGAAHDIADTDEGVIDKLIEWNSQDFLQKTSVQLQELIDSNMDDDELNDFIHDKLGSAYVAASGQSREWLINICKIIKQKTNP